MSDVAHAAGPGPMPEPFLGTVVQVCMVTADHQRMMEQFVKLGIGPWQILTLSKPRISQTLLYGEPHDFEVIRCLAFVNGFVWEIIEPVSGTSIFHDFLEAHGEGIQHLGMTHRTADFDGCVKQFEAQGYPLVQTGLWDEQLRYGFFATDQAIGAHIEIWEKPDGFVEPKPERWFPAAAG